MTSGFDCMREVCHLITLLPKEFGKALNEHLATASNPNPHSPHCNDQLNPANTPLLRPPKHACGDGLIRSVGATRICWGNAGSETSPSTARRRPEIGLPACRREVRAICVAEASRRATHGGVVPCRSVSHGASVSPNTFSAGDGPVYGVQPNRLRRIDIHTDRPRRYDPTGGNLFESCCEEICFGLRDRWLVARSMKAWMAVSWGGQKFG